MNKIIIFALLGVSYTFAATALTVTCNDTADINYNGVCQLQKDHLCKKYYQTGADVGKCEECHVAGGATNGSADSKVNCACTNSKIFLIHSGTYKCDAEQTTADVTCPPGWGKSAENSGKVTCHICDSAACSKCDGDKAKCTECFSSGGTIASDACPADATNKYLIERQGWVAACPDGYFQDESTTPKLCSPCLAGCKTCAKADIATKCLTCAEGYLLDSDKCTKAATATGADACGATCKAQKCATTAAFCTECLDDKHVWTAAGTCTVKPTVFGCKEYVDGKTDECKTCDTGYKLEGKVCVCATAGQYIKETKYAAASGATAAVYWKIECAACDPACTAPKVCLADGTCGDAPAATTAAATVATSDQPGAACTDATLKASGCVKCADGTKCDTCFAGQAFNTTEKVCLCSAGADTAAWDAATMKCVNCPAKCADATKKFCNIKTAGTASTAAVAECTGTAPAAAAKAAGEAAAAAATGNDSNGILISAISMILAVILA